MHRGGTKGNVKDGRWFGDAVPGVATGTNTWVGTEPG